MYPHYFQPLFILFLVFNISIDIASVSEILASPFYELIAFASFVFCFFFVFLGLHPWHMEVPWLEVELELHPLACTTATAMPDLS